MKLINRGGTANKGKPENPNTTDGTRTRVNKSLNFPKYPRISKIDMLHGDFQSWGRMKKTLIILHNADNTNMTDELFHLIFRLTVV